MKRQDSMNELEEPLRQAVVEIRSEAFSESSAQRLLSSARDLASDEQASNWIADSSPTTQSAAARMASKVIALVVVAATLLLVVAFWPRESQAWEEVLAAIAKRPWLSQVYKVENRECELWYGREGNTRACKASLGETNYFFFTNHKEKVTDYFSTNMPHSVSQLTNKVVRSSLPKINPAGDAAIRQLEAALLGQIDGMILDSYEIDTREIVEVTNDGERLLEYRFKIRVSENHHPTQIVIVVDPITKLPVEKRVTGPKWCYVHWQVLVSSVGSARHLRFGHTTLHRDC